jgi:hypothetical protein
MKSQQIFLKATFIIAILFSTIAASTAQQKFNQHNPYVSNSEIHHLKKMGIDLFDKPFTDAEFQKNVRRTFDLKAEYDSDKSKFAALGVASLLGITAGIAGILIDMEESDGNVVNGGGNPVNQTDIKSQYILLGAAGAITAGFALKARGAREASKTKFEQQLAITKGQFDVLR